MKLFRCHACQQLLYFENTRCEKCGHALGFSSEAMDMVTLRPTGLGAFVDVMNPWRAYRYCANAEHQTCNWLLPAMSDEIFCEACQLNHTIPDLNILEYWQRWQKVEIAKHRLVYTLLKMGLFDLTKKEEDRRGLAFDFLADVDKKEKIITGHDHGLITINISEADEARRIRTREKLGEIYRTLLGHFRHETGHYYWDRLIEPNERRLLRFREMFGDERRDYTEALNLHYQNGPLLNWADHFVSAYATAHPWEDWAETWAHYLHIMDAVETACAFGMRINPGDDVLSAEYASNPFAIVDFRQVLNMWFPLTIATNSLNRSMGHPDFYPFVIAPPVVEKLSFIHSVCRAVRRGASVQLVPVER
ncbi:MAG TPA: putative zinc-binding peptidase [Chryseolinea sp.]